MPLRLEERQQPAGQQLKGRAQAAVLQEAEEQLQPVTVMEERQQPAGQQLLKGRAQAAVLQEAEEQHPLNRRDIDNNR
jgi:hypothetical protein